MARMVVRGPLSRCQALAVACLATGSGCLGAIDGSVPHSDATAETPHRPGAPASPPAAPGGGPGVASPGAPVPLGLGPTFARRLNRAEYNNTVRDLLGTALRPADGFPPDDIGNGFDNQGELLAITPLHLESYEAAAERLVDELLAAPAERRGQIIGCDVARGGKACAREVLTRFARRAHRRPPTDAQVDRLVGFLDVAAANGASPEAGLGLALRAVLVSPRFLFRLERPGTKGDRPLDDHELATRLSYLVWSSMPDARLFAAADEGRLTSESGLASEVDRLLADPRAAAFVESFGGQWLYTRRLAAHEVEEKSFPELDGPLREAKAEETRRFFAAFLAEAHPVRELLTANFTYTNARLARHYGLPGGGEGFTRVSLPPGERRGLLGHGSLLTVTSYPNRTSPVIRGKWVLEELLCSGPPPPPADVEGLDEVASKVGGTVREILEHHRRNPACQPCHKVMDEIGLGLEVFDGIGRVRTRDAAGQPIDASGVLPGGKTFKGAAALADILATDDRLLACATRKVMIYALGRGLDAKDDDAWVAHVAGEAQRGGGSLAAVVRALVQSDLFRKRG